jgi:hypothetical protein
LHAWLDIGFCRQTAAVAAAAGKWKKSLDIQDDLSMAERLEKGEKEP